MIRGLAAAGLVLLVGVATHVDYHLGRGPELPPSLDWPYHWVLGVVVGVVVTLIAARVWQTALPRVVAIAFGGLLLGHGVEPVLEGCFGMGQCGYTVDAERWEIFFAFVVALAGGIALGLGLARWRAPSPSPSR